MTKRKTLDSDALFFNLLDVVEITGKKVRTLQRHLERRELTRASPPRKKVLIAREELLIFIDKMHRGLL